MHTRCQYTVPVFNYTVFNVLMTRGSILDDHLTIVSQDHVKLKWCGALFFCFFSSADASGGRLCVCLSVN